MLAQRCRGNDGDDDLTRFIELARRADDPAGLPVLGRSTGHVERLSSTAGIQEVEFDGAGDLEGSSVHDAGRLSYEGTPRSFVGRISRVFSGSDGATLATLRGGHVGWHRLGRLVTVRVVGLLDAPTSDHDGQLALAVVEVKGMETFAARMYLLGPEPRVPDVSPEPDAQDLAQRVRERPAVFAVNYFDAGRRALPTWRPQDAADAVQDVALADIEDRTQSGADTAGPPDRRRILRNKAIDISRRNNRRRAREEKAARQALHPDHDPLATVVHDPFDCALVVASWIAGNTVAWDMRIRKRRPARVECFHNAVLLMLNDISLVDYLLEHHAYDNKNAAGAAVSRFRTTVQDHLTTLGFIDGKEGWFAETADFRRLGRLLEAGRRLVFVEGTQPPYTFKPPMRVVAGRDASFLADGRGRWIGRFHAELLRPEGSRFGFVVDPTVKASGTRSGR